MKRKATWMVLFDIDGTLLDTGGLGCEAFRRGLARATGEEDDLAYVSFAGNTDRNVLAQVMERRGRRFDEAHAQRIFSFVAEELRALLAEAAVREIPGAGAFVACLAEAGAALGLVTGNIRACAYLKLGSIGLDGYFGFGGFGDVHAERSKIARSALESARRAGVRTDRICLVGDTPYDVAAGRALGVPVLGVASGHYAAPELLAAGAGRTAADFRDLAGWMEWLEETLESQ
ncbi:MAG TPA: HAD hydrolase-like protein [Kiritimatiellia bacterium]|nr:HAD hydrolase-like protein [Kiritimatiellia bacterium]HPR67717.1 HAD hydrolase-like protein [Kiritimatiellia bacterium]